MGAILAFPQQADLGMLSVSFEGTAPLPEGLYAGIDALALVNGDTFSQAGVLAFQSAQLNGSILNSYFQDYYNRIWILPSAAISFGEVGGVVSRSLILWNAYLFDVSIVDLTDISVDNIQVNNLEVGDVIDSLDTRTVTFVTNETGPAEIQSFYQIQFSFGDFRVININGRRSLRWPDEDFRVNWAEPYEVTMEFRTEIFTSRNGKEQRRAQRSTPRKNISYLTTLTPDLLRRYNAILTNRQTRTFTLPEETKTVTLSQDALTASNELTFEAVPDWVRVGFNYSLLLGRRREVVQVASIAGNSVFLTGPLLNDWAENSYFVPVHTVRMAMSVSAPRLTNGVATVQQSFEVLPTSEPYGTTVETYPLYESLPIFTERHNWRNSLDTSYVYEREELDYGKGLVRYYTPIDFATQTRSLTFETGEVARADSIRDFFLRRKGMREEFWLPTWEQDFVIRGEALLGSDTIRVQGRDVFDYYQEDKVHRNIILFMQDGTLVPRRLSAITLVSDAEGEDTALQFTEDLPFNVSADNIRLFSWLVRARFATDILRVQWLTRETSSVTIGIKTLEDLP